MTVTWWAASDNVAVTDYEYSYEKDGNKSSWFSAGVVTTKTISGLAASTLYTVYIRAKDAAGNISSDISGMCTTSGDTTRPGQPGIPEISNFTNTSVTATWTAATDDVGVTGYEYKLNENGSWVPVNLVLTANLSGLTANTTYTVYVRARDAAGNYTLIPPSKQFTTLNLIGAPGAPLFSGIGVNSVIASWAAATGNVASYEYSINSGSTWVNVGNTLTTTISGLSAGSTYSVLIRGKSTSGIAGQSSPPASVITLNGNPGTPVASNITTTTATLTWTASSGTVSSYRYSINSGATWINVGNVLSVNLTGLTAGVTYTFHLQPINTAGVVGPAAQPKDFTTLVSIGIPGTPVSSNITQTSATITWSAASGPVASYEYSKDGGSNWVNVGNTLSANITGLNAGTTYIVLVRAKNSSGVPGSVTPPINVTTLNGNPGTPVASNITTTTATLTWTASSGTVSSYQYSINSGSTWVDVGNVLSVNLTGLTAGVTYPFHLQPKNTAGAVGPAAQPTGFTTLVALGVPTSVTSSNVMGTSATLSWSAASGPVALYEYTKNGESSWVNVGNVLSTSIATLSHGTTYTFSIRAKDASGNAGTAAPINVTTLNGNPGTPVVSNVTTSSATVTWTASSGTVSSYQYTINGGSRWVDVGNVLSVSLTGLSAGSSYTFYVQPKNAVGAVGPVAQPIIITTLNTAPGIPSASNITSTTASISWAASGGTVQSYEYSINNQATWISTGTATSANLSLLNPGTTYTAYVRAKNSNGVASATSQGPFTTVANAVSLTNMNVINPAVYGTATYKLETNGDISAYQSGSNSIVVVGRWLATGLSSSNYYVRATLIGSRACTSGYTNGAWSPVYTATWSYGTAYSTTSCSFMLEIAPAGTTSSILASAQITLTAGKTP